MAPVEALHTAARRYCIEQGALWSARYQALCARGEHRPTLRGGTFTYSDAAYDTFPRYHVLAAIRNEIERLVPAELRLLENARVRLATAGELASSAVTRGGDRPIERAAMQQERDKFVAFVRSLTPRQLDAVPPLPFRRVLRDEEFRRFATQVNERWGKWRGGASDKLDLPEHLTLQRSLLTDSRIADLRAVLRERRIDRPFEIREFGESYEIGLDIVGFDHGADGEGTWCEPGARWMINASHEDSLTLGGGWLVAEAQKRWSDWPDLRYRGYDGQLIPIE